MYYLSYHPNTNKYVRCTNDSEKTILSGYHIQVPHSARWICFATEMDRPLVTNMQNMPKGHSETYKIHQTNLKKPSNTIYQKVKNNSNLIHPNLPSPQKPSLLTKRCKFAMRWHRANDMIRATRIDGTNKGACLQETAAIANPDW